MAVQFAGLAREVEQDRARLRHDDAIVIDAYSVQKIKQALQTLYESPDARERFAMAGQAAVSSLMAGQTARLYDEGIERLLAAAREKSAAAVV